MITEVTQLHDSQLVYVPRVITGPLRPLILVYSHHSILRGAVLSLEENHGSDVHQSHAPSCS